MLNPIVPYTLGTVGQKNYFYKCACKFFCEFKSVKRHLHMMDLDVQITQKKFGQDITCKKSTTAKIVIFVRQHPTLP